MKLKNLLLLIFALFLSSLNAHDLMLNDGFGNTISNIGGNGNYNNFPAAAFLPTATISGTATVCQNGTAEITFTGANGTAPYTFTYNINNGPDITVTTTTGDSVIVTADTSVDGVFEYNLTNVAFGTNPGDSQPQTGTATVTVKPLPTAAITGSATICLNAATPNITFTGSGGIIPYTFTYNINNGGDITVTTSNSNSVNVPVPTNATGTFVYNLVKISSGGTCEQLQTGSATVKVFGVPAATVSGTATVCLNDDKPNVTFTGTNGEPPYTFSYNINNGPAQTITTYVQSVNIPIDTNVSGTFTYNLTGVSYAGVSGCSQAQTGSATVTVNKLPTATIIPSVTSVCVNAASPTVTFTGTDGTGPYTFTYNVNNGADQTITTTSGNTVTITVPTGTPGIFDYNLVAVSSGAVTACAQVQTGSATVYVGVYAEISAPFSSICPGYSVDVNIKGTPNATINFTSAPDPGNYSVILNANGEGVFTPFVTATTTFTLTNGTLASPACVNNLSDTAVVLVNTTGPCAPTPKAEIEIESPIPVCALGDCTDLTASYYQLRPTTDYEVVSTPYQNLYPYTGGTLLNANQDDVWASAAYMLPFSFCFYGNNYSQVLVGSNGLITFDIAGVVPGATATPGQYCEWNFATTIPDTNFPIRNAIYGVYQDTNIFSPPVANPAVQNVNYYVGGIAPNRYFVANFNELPQYQCNNNAGLQTSQIILHETTNIIDVYIKKRTPCTTWNPTPTCCGNGVVGLQNHAGTKATVPPGRNTSAWTATNEAWRFLPAGAGDLVSIEWKDAGGNVISTQNTINVCPTGPETYTVEASYTKCDNTIFTPKPNDTITIDIEPALPVLDPEDIFMCTNVEPFHFNINQDAYILNGSVASDYDILYYEDEQSAKDYGSNDIFSTYGTINDYVVASAAALPKTLWVRITDLTSGTGCANIRSFIIDASQPAGSISYPDATYYEGGPAVAVIGSTDLTPGGVYTAAPVDPSATPPQVISINSATGEIDLVNTTAGEYIITYTVAATAYCPQYVTTSTSPNPFKVYKDTACTVNASNDFAICQGTSFNLTATISPDDDTPTFEWSGPENFTSTAQNPLNVPSPSVAGVYTYTVIKKNDGIECATDSVIVTVYELPSVAFVTPSSSICTNAPTTINFTGSANAFVTFNVTDTNGANNDVVVQLDSTGNYDYPATLQYDTTYELVKVESNTTPVCSIPFPPGTAITITVGLPDATVSITNNVICSGDPAIFTINGNPGATVDYTVGATAATTTLDASGTAPVTLTGLTGNTTLTLTNVTSNSTPSCSKALNVSASVTVNPLPVVNTFTGATVTPICSGTPATLLINGTPNATVTYTDSSNNTYPPVVLDASGNASFTTPAIPVSETFTLINITSSGPVQCMNVATQSITIYTIASPAITTQPAGALACNGASVTFTVVASGSNLHYQWYNNLGNAVGADQDSYTIAAPTPADAGNYTVTVTNGCGAETSQPANLAVSQPTIITAQPVGGTVCEGDTIQIAVTATGVNLQYKWFKDTPTNELPGETNSTLIITPATLADAGTYFSEISNACETVLSNNAVIVVNELIAIDTQPSAVTLCEGESFTLSVVASGTNPAYQWYNTYGIIPGAVNADYTVSSALNANDDSDYYVVVSGACIPSVTSATVHVTVNKQPVIVTQPIGVTACEGETVTLSITATGTNLVYQWQQNGIDEVGATSDTLTIPVSALSDAGTYICFVSNSVSSCPPVSSDPAEVIINVAPAIVTQPVSRIVCLGDSVNFTVGATGNNLTYQWYYENVAVAADGTSNSYTIPVTQLSNSGHYKVIVSSPSCPSVTSADAYLIVNPLPEATIHEGNEPVICEGEAADVIFTGTPNAVVTYTINGGEELTIILSPSGSAILPTGVLEGSATYTLISVATNDTPVCTKSLLGEPNTVATIQVNVLPDPKLDQDGYICINQATNAVERTYTLDSGYPNTGQYTFEWSFNDVVILTETGPSIVADSVGVYKIKIIDVATGCTRAATAPITASLQPISIITADVVTGFFDDNATIVVTVDPPGDYEYSLDDGPFQDSNTFTGVRTLINFDESGHHTVWARDKKDCKRVNRGVEIVDYPKYFTPNGDGFHDTWNITTLRNHPDTKIFIFDRFGKLLKEISSTGTGWDGTFNGKPMIADDYWFVVKYTEQNITKEFKAHFAIKR